MSLPITEGLSSSVGDELNDLAGLRSTRLTAELLGENPVTSAVGTASGTAGSAPVTQAGTWTWNGTTTVLATNTTGVAPGDFIRLDSDGQLFQIASEVANVSVTVSNPGSLTIPSGTGATSRVGPTVVTLSGGTFGAAEAGDRFRLTSGTLAGRSERINTVDSSTQVTLRGPIATPAASFSAESWEVVTEPETVAEVEDVTFWDAVGRMFIGGTLYRYASRTATELRGLEHWDDTAWVDGARENHPVLTEVVDWTRNFSAIDRTRRGFLIEFAEGEDLTAFGRNHGVLRPPELADDDIYRALIRAVAYGARGPRLCLDRALDALVGEGNWERFEDFTGAIAEHFAKVFLRRTDVDPTDPVGRAYLGGEVRRPITNTTTIGLTETPLTVAGVRLANDPVGERLIATGTLAQSSNLGVTVTGPASSFPTRIQRGDLFIITGGPQKGKIGTVQTRVSDTQLTLGVVRGADNLAINANFQPASWKIIRAVSNFRHYLPSAETYLEYDGDAGTTIWTWTGVSTTEGASVAHIDDAVLGLYLSIGDPSNAATTGYFHRLRARSESRVRFELYASFASAGIGTGANDGRQMTGEIRDGSRTLAWGVIGDSGGTFARIGLIDASTGAFINSASGLYQYAYTLPNFQMIRLEKRGTNLVELWIGAQRVDTAPYTSFPTTTDNQLTFGCFSTSLAPVMQVKQADWHAETVTDYWNARAAAATLTGGGSRAVASLGGIALSGDVGRRLVISNYTEVNAGGGTPYGEWEIDGYTSANEVTVTGPRRRGATFPGSPNRMIVEKDSFAFRWPYHKGHQVQILSGANAGTYSIVNLLDPVAFTDLDLLPNGSIKAMIDELPSYLASHADVPSEIATNAVELNNGTPFTPEDEPVDWRLIPVFPADAGPVACEIDNASTVSGTTLTLRQALPYGISGGWTPLVSVLYSVLRSGQVSDERDENEALGGGDYQLWPFYLSDFWGYVRRVIQGIVLSGVIVDFDSLARDESGLHILED